MHGNADDLAKPTGWITTSISQHAKHAPSKAGGNVGYKRILFCLKVPYMGARATDMLLNYETVALP